MDLQIIAGLVSDIDIMDLLTILIVLFGLCLWGVLVMVIFIVVILVGPKIKIISFGLLKIKLANEKKSDEDDT